MKKILAQLRPMERRLAVGVLVVFVLVLNWWFIWPHFSDWGNLRYREDVAQKKLELYRTTITETAKYDALVKNFESQGQVVAPEDQAINFMSAVGTQAAASGFTPNSYGRQNVRTNQFFTEQSQSITVVATDSQLVDFLYKLGESASMVRVRELDLYPDAPHQHLNATIQLIASYKKKMPEMPVPAATATAMKIPAAVKTNSKPATVKSK